jgi:hypothetical protein
MPRLITSGAVPPFPLTCSSSCTKLSFQSVLPTELAVRLLGWHLSDPCPARIVLRFCHRPATSPNISLCFGIPLKQAAVSGTGPVKGRVGHGLQSVGMSGTEPTFLRAHIPTSPRRVSVNTLPLLWTLTAGP